MAFTESQLSEEKSKHESWLTHQPGMNGIGIGLTADGDLCLKIYIDRMPDATMQQIQDRLGKVPVEFEETSEFRAF